MRKKENEEPLFDITDRGYNLKGWYLKDTETEKGDALVEITRDGVSVRTFIFPAYKIWNVPAHFPDIVDSEISGDIKGYEEAASTGLGGSVGIKEAK